MARGVSDAKKDWFILTPGAGERFLTPGIPVDGIVLMLEKVRRLLGSEPIRVLMMRGHVRFGRFWRFLQRGLRATRHQQE